MKKVESVKQRTFYTAFWPVGSPVVLAGGKMDKMSSLTLDLVALLSLLSCNGDEDGYLVVTLVALIRMANIHFGRKVTTNRFLLEQQGFKKCGQAGEIDATF